jgi:adenylate cyclase
VGAQFCDACGSPIASLDRAAEFKQVTVLFADVVHSMDIAAAVGAERLREIMTELVNRSAAVVQRYGGTVDKFTGDGIMAVFGAPIALEDHAFRACMAAMDIQDEASGLAAEVNSRDGIDLQLRVGLNSGQVIVGEIGSSPLSYTAVGEQVGIAKRMESAAPPGGVMLSEATARLVERNASLGDPELVPIKGADTPVPARRLLGTATDRRHVGGIQTPLVGRDWEMNTITGILDQAIAGKGSVVDLVGPPGIGKTRLVAETTSIAASRGVDVFTTYCESHASEIPFHAVTRLLREVFGIRELRDDVARSQVRARTPDADPEDLVLLDDLLGIRDQDVDMPDISADARRRRLAALLNAAALARAAPALYVIEDVHWIDDVSESMLVELASIVPQTSSFVVVTYRPEYCGAFDRISNAHRIALVPLDDSQTATLTSELVGSDRSVSELVGQIAGRAAGNPFFAEEMVRDLAERGILTGSRGHYVCRSDTADVNVPATLHATIASRIDRLDVVAKRTLNAAAVIGSRFGQDLLAELTDNVDLTALIGAELIDQVMFTPRAEYAFRHPLIRTVAYKSQLKAQRADLHRRAAAAIQRHNPDSTDENAPLIATHLEAAGDFRAAFDWHMRAGTLLNYREIGAARTSWQRARAVADQLPPTETDRLAMQIAPRALLCGTAFRIGADIADIGFEELRAMCDEADDQASLAIGMGGLLMALVINERHAESSQVAMEYNQLLELIGDPTLTVGLLGPAAVAKYEAGEMIEALRMAQRVIDLADDDATKGELVNESPLITGLVFRGVARCCLGMPGWRDDFDRAIAMSQAFSPTSPAVTTMYKYGHAVGIGALIPDAAALRATAEALEIAERSGDDFALGAARMGHGLALAYRDEAGLEAAFDVLAALRDAAVQGRYARTVVRIVDLQTARRKARTGDVDGAIEVARNVIDALFESGEMFWRGPGTTVLVDSLLQRGGDADLAEAEAAIDRLAAVPTDPGYVLHELPLLRLRALLARAKGDKSAYCDFRDRYRKMATDLGFEGHMALAEAMT